jgi:glucose-6-phosphate 1-dehydrogenase
MEPPYHFDPDAVRDEKLKVIRALDPVAPEDIVRGQYLAGAGSPAIWSMRKPRQPHRKLCRAEGHISNWRWKGTPFYLRTGKRLRARASEIAMVTFKEPPHSIFDDAKRAGAKTCW